MPCFARFNGMWGLAIWDIPRRRLVLSRDRTGIKPLYLWQDAARFAFASEIKALLALGLPRRANETALYDFLAGNLSDHTDATSFAGVISLPPAHTLTLDLTTGAAIALRYWQLDPDRQLRLPSDAAYADAFRELFEDAVRRHLISDVAVGTCLSGGLDSSAVVCVINQLIRQRGLHVVGMETRQKTFSARWADPRHDEGRFIDAVVDASDVDGRTIYPTAADLRAEWPRLFWHQEEPFGSTSIFAQWNVFKLARETGVTVTLDGQGGDELLAGYLGFFPPHLGRSRDRAALAADAARAGRTRRAARRQHTLGAAQRRNQLAADRSARPAETAGGRRGRVAGARFRRRGAGRRGRALGGHAARPHPAGAQPRRSADVQPAAIAAPLRRPQLDGLSRSSRACRSSTTG